MDITDTPFMDTNIIKGCFLLLEPIKDDYWMRNIELGRIFYSFSLWITLDK